MQGFYFFSVHNFCHFLCLIYVREKGLKPRPRLCAYAQGACLRVSTAPRAAYRNEHAEGGLRAHGGGDGHEAVVAAAHPAAQHQGLRSLRWMSSLRQVLQHPAHLIGAEVGDQHDGAVRLDRHRCARQHRQAAHHHLRAGDGQQLLLLVTFWPGADWSCLQLPGVARSFRIDFALQK